MTARPRLVLLGILAVVALLSAAPRMLLDERLHHDDGGGWTTNDPDSVYHMRRLQRALDEELPVAGRDPFLSYPDGAAIPWPPGYTYLLFAVLGPFTPDEAEARREWIEHGTASLPFAFGVLTSVVVALAGYVLAGRAGALVAGGYHALCLGSVLYSRLGNGDHHAVVSLLMATELLLLSVVLSRGVLESPRRSIVWGAAIGAIAGYLLDVWVASLLYVIGIEIVLAWLLFLHARLPGDEDRRGLPAFGLAFHAGAMALVLPAVWMSPWREEAPWIAVNLSWFHPAFFLLGAMVFVPLLVISRESFAYRRYPWVVGAVLAALGVAFFALELGPAAAIREGFEWVSRQDRFMADVRESRPLLGSGASPREHFTILGYLSPLLPVAWMAALWAALRRRALPLVPWIVAVPLLAPQAAQQMRFVDALAPPMAVLLGWGAATLLALQGGSAPAALASRLRRLPAVALGAVALACVALAHVDGLRPDPDVTGSEDRAAYQRALRRTFDWMRLQTPATGDYAVLANWEFGHEIEWAAERPTVATNFGSYVGPEAYRDPARFFLAEDEAAAEAVLERRQARYVVATATQAWIVRYLQNALGPEYEDRYVWTDDDGRHGMNVERWCATIGARLVLGGQTTPGSPLEAQLGGAVPAVSFLRLVYTSPVHVPGVPFLPSFLEFVPAAWVYEHVPGARVEARAPVGTRLVLEVDVELPGLPRPVRYRAQAVAGAEGVARVRVPYCTAEPGGAGRASGPARWTLGASGGTLVIEEADVREGRTLRVP